jgi:hypothetical protein
MFIEELCRVLWLNLGQYTQMKPGRKAIVQYQYHPTYVLLNERKETTARIPTPRTEEKVNRNDKCSERWTTRAKALSPVLEKEIV